MVLHFCLPILDLISAAISELAFFSGTWFTFEVTGMMIATPTALSIACISNQQHSAHPKFYNTLRSAVVVSSSSRWLILACWVASASTGISDVFWARGRNMRASAGKGFTYAPLSLSCQKLSKRKMTQDKRERARYLIKKQRTNNYGPPLTSNRTSQHFFNRLQFCFSAFPSFDSH